MNDLLSSIKADLTDRRLLPLVAVVAAAFVGSIAYVLLAGGSSSSAPTAAVAPIVSPANGGLAVNEANPSSEKAVAETTDGIHVQRQGSARNPFAPLPSETPATTTPAASTASTGSSTASSTGSGSGSSSSGEETKPEEPTTQKPKTAYHVTVLFGTLTPNPATNEVTLTPYANLKLYTRLPSAKTPLIVYRGVTAGGKSATFTIVGEAILHGNGKCLPSAFQCHALDLKPGQSEVFEYLPEGALTTTSYELRLVAIAPVKASASSAKVAHTAAAKASANQSQSGWEFLRHAHLLQIPGLRQSSQPGVLVFAPHHAHAAHAHISAQSPALIG